MSAVSGKDLVASVEGELDSVPSGTSVLVRIKERRDYSTLLVPTWAAGPLSKVHSVVYHLLVLGLFPGPLIGRMRSHLRHSNFRTLSFNPGRPRQPYCTTYFLASLVGALRHKPPVSCMCVSLQVMWSG